MCDPQCFITYVSTFKSAIGLEGIEGIRHSRIVVYISCTKT